MKLLEFKVEGFRSLKQTSWEPDNLNVVIGPNGSGKSNLLKAIELIAASANGKLGSYVQGEGGMNSISWDGQATAVKLSIHTSPIEPGRAIERDSLRYQFELARLGYSSAYRIEDEMLANWYRVEVGERAEPFKLLERNANHAVVFDENQRGLTAPAESVPEEETLLSLAAGPFTANRLIPAYQKQIADWRVYHSFETHRQAAIRQPAITKNDTSVLPNGTNLISVLHTLYTSRRDFKNEVNAAMRAAFSDDFDELIFPPAADQRIQLRLRWKSLQREQSSADLSDGTLRFLFLLTVLANPSPPSLIAIDEPETGLHPSMLPIVAEYAEDAASRTQVILTTHSAQLLDAFTKGAPATTVVKWVNGQTELHRLSDASLDYWLQHYTLGSLQLSGELEEMQ